MKRFAWMVMCLALVGLTGMAESGWAVDQSQLGRGGQPAPRMMCMDRFDAMDSDDDGMVTVDEFVSVRHPRCQGDDVFKLKDTNDDGALTKAEFCAGKGRGRGRAQ